MQTLKLNLDPWQIKFLKTTGDKILCTGRQVGKSVVCGIDAGEYAITHKNKVILMIAPTERQARALFEKTLTYIIDNKPNSIMKGRNRPTKSKITLKNKTIIWCLPTGLSGLGIRFLTVHRLYADEASRIPEAVWTAVTPMLLTTGGDTILLSTPFGVISYYYDVLSNKNNAFKSFTRFYCDSETVVKERKICRTWTLKQKEKALEHLEAERARMTTLEYAQEYLGRPLQDLRQVFPDDLLTKCCVLKRRDKIITDRRYYLGVDVARMGNDESTFEIIDRTNTTALQQVENIVTKKTLTTDTAEKCILLNKQYDFKQIFIDDGGMGVGVFDQLLTHEDTRRKTIAINNTSRPLDREELKKKRVLKEDIYNNMLALMERGEIKLLDDPEVIQSLRSVQFEISKTNNKIRYHGNYTHIAEGLVRAAWCVKDNRLGIYIY